MIQSVKNNVFKIKPESITEPLIIQDNSNLIFCFLAISKNNHDEFWSDCGMAVFKTKSCWLSKYGYPNDEAIECHPLFDFGYDGTSIAQIINSKWVAEIESQNRKKWPESDFSRIKHFIFPFKETTLEILVEYIDFELTEATYSEIREKMLNWIVENEN